jgi:hypothetical protein
VVDVDVVNGTGDQIKAEADKLAETLEVKYGKYTKKYDFASESVYERNPQYWMMGLKEDAVTYSYVWRAVKKQSTLPNNISSIAVNTSAISSSAGAASIIYSFSNAGECFEEIKKNKSSNL